jgi:hypothetical protein
MGLYWSTLNNLNSGIVVPKRFLDLKLFNTVAEIEKDFGKRYGDSIDFDLCNPENNFKYSKRFKEIYALTE